MPDNKKDIRQVLEHRSSVLASLISSPARKPELVDALDSSRSTVDRAIDELVSAGCVYKEGRKYIPTTAGRLAFEKYEEYEETTNAISETTAFVNSLPEDAPLDTALLKGSSVTMSSDHAPDQALASSTDLFKRSTRMRGLAPVVLSFYPSYIADQLALGDLTVEIIASPDVLGAIPSLPDFGSVSLAEAEELQLYESDQELPYALWLMDTPESSYAGITAYNKGGVAGVLINDSQAAVEWAEAEYERYRSAASETSLPT